MSVKAILWESIDSLYSWVKKEGYYGWDPYDALNSRIVQRLCMGNPYLEILIIQFNKYSPINLRPLLKIEKGRDLKGTALFAQAHSKMYNITKEERYKEDLKKCNSFIKEKSLKNKYKLDCWASHYFPYTGAVKSRLTIDTPDIIGTCQAIIALVESYKILKENTLKEMAVKTSNFLIKDLLEKDGEDFFLKYTLTEKDRIVLNASAQGLEAMSHLLPIYEDEKMKDVCERLVNFLIKKQRENGSWVYSIYKRGKVRIQLDFHQGYVIDGLLAFLPYSKNKEAVISCIEKGAEFYKEVLFLENGQSYYRYPMRYPVDIHHLAQGIITFSKLDILDTKYLEFAKKIAEWTVLNMQDNSGYFYYQKYRLFTNRISYMRWGQAWMMLALATLLEKSEGERK
jgi:uncharacterized protein YyaL (SSP411 family)